MPFFLVSNNYKIESHLPNDMKTELGGTFFKKLWKYKQSPIGEWRISANEILSQKNVDNTKNKLVIDISPKSINKIEIFELIDLYAYTWKNVSNKKISVTNIMLKLNAIIDKFEDYDFIATFPDNSVRYEFIYILGDDNNWNWGQVGRVNAALLTLDELKYFYKCIL